MNCKPDVDALEQITKQTAADYVENLKTSNFTASTFNQHKNFLKLVWPVLLPEKPNPWTWIKSRRLDPLANRKKAVTPTQFESVLAAAEADPDLRDALLLLAWSGLRLTDFGQLSNSD